MLCAALKLQLGLLSSPGGGCTNKPICRNFRSLGAVVVKEALNRAGSRSRWTSLAVRLCALTVKVLARTPARQVGAPA